MARTAVRPESAVDPLEEPVRRYLLTGDEEALDLVVRETRLRLLAAARRIGAPQDAEDSVQAAYLSLVRKRGEPLGAPVFPWLLTAVVRTAYRRKALARREEALARRLARPPAGPSAFTLAAGREIEERIGRAVERLPAAYRDPVVLHYLAGLSTRETAGLLDLPEATVRTRLRRARILLRSRVPAGLVHGLFLVPWFLKDAVEGAGSSMGIATAGGLVMKAGGVAVVALGAAALGTMAGANLFVKAPPAPPPGPDPATVESRIAAERESLEKAHRTALKALETERDEARRAAAAAEGRAAAAEKAAAEKPAPAPAPVAAAKGPSFSFPEYDDALGKIDWKSVGDSARAMVPLMQGLHDSIRKGEKPDIKALGRIQQLNGALIKAAAEVNEKLPGDGINGAYTHPAFMANAMAATLEAAGLPLTATQAEALGKLGREFSDRENARVQGYDDKSYAMQKILDEAELKDRFFEQAFALFTPEQREAVSPAATRGVMGIDLFSSGLLLQMHAQGMPSMNLDGYLGQVESVLLHRAEFPADRTADLKAAIKAWSADLPAEWFAGETEPLFKVAYVEEVGRRTVVLLKKVAEEMSVPDVCAKKLHEAAVVLLPMIKKAN